MNALTIQAQDFRPSLINEFLAYIDRPGRTEHTYLTNLKQFAAWLCFKEIRQPVRNDIVNYREWLSSEHEAIKLDASTPAGWRFRLDPAGHPLRVICKPNTIAQYLRSVCQFFRWTASAGLYPDIAAGIHAPKIRHDTHRKDALQASEVLEIENSILAGAGTEEQRQRLYCMFLLATNAGLRTVELHRANIKDFVTKGGASWLYIWGKGHTEPDQIKALAPEVAQAIRDYLSMRTDSKTGTRPLFTSTGNRSGGQRIATTTISTMLKKAMQAAGYDSERLTAHSLRHTAGSNVMEITGDNLFITQTYMRHTDPKTTEIYLHRNTEKQDTELAKRLYNHYHGGADPDSRARLELILNNLNSAQLDKLADIAQALAG